jgi:hypothetical protein
MLFPIFLELLLVVLYPSPDSTTLLSYCGESSICSFVTSWRDRYRRSHPRKRDQLGAESFQRPIAVHHEVANFHGVVVKDHVIDLAEFFAV